MVSARNWAPSQPAIEATVATLILAAMAAAGVWWGVLMVPVANRLDELLSAEDQRVAAIVVFHGLGAAAVIAASLAAFRWRLRGTPNLRGEA